MSGNTATDGAAVAVQSDGSVVVNGRGNFFTDNTANAGGAFGIGGAGASLRVDGRLCASGNKAEFSGGFAVVNAGAQLILADGSEAYFDDNTQTCCGNSNQDTVVMTSTPTNRVQCGVDAPSWTDNKVYGITGAACACNASFVAVPANADPYINECNNTYPADCDPLQWEDTCVSVTARPWSLCLVFVGLSCCCVVVCYMLLHAWPGSASWLQRPSVGGGRHAVG
jgi:hypothetical protein